VKVKHTGFFLGLFVFFLILSLPTFNTFHAAAAEFADTHNAPVLPTELARSMQVALALLLLMVCWWVTEAIPLPATALLPTVVLPFFRVVGVEHSNAYLFTPKALLANYANPVIFLFLGGFLMAAALQKWKLDRRLTLWLLTQGSIANDARLVLLAVMSVTAFLSMWISNTATAALMLPLGLGILALAGGKPGESRFGTALMLGIAWSASVGGIGTIIGTPPNGIGVGILNSTFGDDPTFHRITFLDWMKFGVPYVILFIPLAWLLLIRLNPPEIKSIPGGKEKLLAERAALGPMTGGEKRTLSLFLLAVVLWVTNPFWAAVLPSALAGRLVWVDEYSIGLFIGTLFFIVPANLRAMQFLLEWRDTKFVDWGTLLLFGGGLALSDVLFKTGLAAWLAHSFVSVLGSPSTLLMMVGVILLIDFLTEITSNTAVTTMFIPIVISIAQQTGENPVALAIAAALAASMAFMLPVATPPNALVFGSGYVRLQDMIRNGFLLDIVGWVFTVAILVLFADLLFGVVRVL
jgi:sodium-dependent dicarboxylate transporter 2/3/5